MLWQMEKRIEFRRNECCELWNNREIREWMKVLFSKGERWMEEYRSGWMKDKKMDEWKDREVDEWKDREVDEWKDRGVDEWKDREVDEWRIEEWMNGRIEKWMNGRIEKWMNGRIEKWMNEGWGEKMRVNEVDTNKLPTALISCVFVLNRNFQKTSWLIFCLFRWCDCLSIESSSLHFHLHPGCFQIHVRVCSLVLIFFTFS